jgi:multidrug efflux system outer membrane protein
MRTGSKSLTPQPSALSPPKPIKASVSKLALTLLSASLCACTVGPDYVRPEPPVAVVFDQAIAAQTDSVQPGGLWTVLGDPDLDALLARARRENRDLAVALARLNETRAITGLTVYSLFPTVTAAGDAERNKPSARDPNLPPDVAQTNDSYRLGFDAIWEIDLFGSLRRQSEAVFRDADAAEAALADVLRSVEAEVAQAYLSWRGTQQRLEFRRRNVANLEENVALLEAMLEAGRGTELDVARQRALGLAVAAQLPTLEAELIRHEQRLAVLTAQPVGELRASLAPRREIAPLPSLIAVGTPQDWLRRRPDVRRSEQELAAATARVGVQMAEFYPKLNLLGSFGWTSARAGGLMEGDAERWRVGPSLSWSFLDFGRVRQRVLAAEARAEGALASFEQTVLRALEETDNALAGYRTTQESAVLLERAELQAREALRLARLRGEAGAGSELDVLDAERTWLDLQDQSLRARIDRATALVALYKALAGEFVEEQG